MDVEKTSGELGGVRKLIQDLIAPELGWLKATLTNVQENQREQFALVREEIKASEVRNLRAIELNSAEIKALIKANDAERRLAEAERRNSELERRLSEATRAAS